MIAAVVAEPGRLELQDVPVPEPGPGQARIRSAYCGICATDLAMIAGTERTRYPMVLGHEWSGIVEAVGPQVDPAILGQRCVAENVWSDGGEVGFEHPGAYGQYFVTQADLLRRLPDEATLQRAALIEPLAVCVRGLRRLRLTDRSSALIFGDGIIGLLTLVLLAREGVSQTTVVGGRSERLARAATLGACRTVNYHEVGGATAATAVGAAGGAPAVGAAGNPGDAVAAAIAAAVRQSVPAGGFPNLVEASGTQAAVEAAFALGGPGAHLLLIGDYERCAASVPWQRWLHAEYEVMASNASQGAWPEAVRLAGELGPRLDPLITHTVSIQQIHRGLELMRGRGSGAIRVLIDWGAGS